MAPATPQAGVFSGLNPAQFNSANPVVLFIIQATIILIFCRVLALPLKWLKQPRVIAEVIAGIILGPSVMGRIPGFQDAIFPSASLPFLNLIATLGLIFFLFQVGLEVDVSVVRRDWRASVSIAFAGMALPFGLGIAVSVGLYKLQDDPSVSFSSFMLFLGVALAITAFPVLARILAELNLLRTRVGALTMASGLLNDCTAWVLLALVVALLNSTGGIEALYVFLTAVGFGLFLIFLVRPLYYRLCVVTGSFENGPTHLLMTVTLLMVLVSAFVTDIIGVHPIFGGFLAGTIIPHERDLPTKITEKIEDVVNIIFLPLYFTLSGLKTQIGLLNTGTVWGYVILVIALACFGKITGCAAAAKLSRMTWRESFTVGFLMNCKGLVELIVLNIGHDAGVLNDQVFVIMVVMALVTTFMTTPVVMWLYPEWYQKQRAEEMAHKGLSIKVSTIPPESSMLATHQSNRYTLVTMLNRLETVPSMMALIKLLKISGNAHKSSISDTASTDPFYTLEIHALRLHELTQRSSDVMKIRDQRETLRRDPVLNVIGTFANLIGIDLLRTRLEFVLPTEYVKIVADHGEQVDADMILLPWTSNRFLPEPNPFDESFFTSSSYQYTLSDADFASQAFSISHTAVGLFVDRGFGIAQDRDLNVVRIIVPFIGGPDDRAAILFALRLQLNQPMAELCVLRFNTHAIEKKYAAPSAIESALYKAKHADPEDDTTFLNNLFTLPSTEITAVTSETIDHDPLQLEDAIQTILSRSAGLTRNDLLVIGRKTTLGGSVARGPMTPSIESPGVQYSKEFKAVLGPVAYGLLSSTMQASLVVVQAANTKKKAELQG